MDDCWQLSRDAQGTIQADSQAFPSGIPALVDYVHSRKLKFGLYSGMILVTLLLATLKIEQTRYISLQSNLIEKILFI
jgi:hypothetical protein